MPAGCGFRIKLTKKQLLNLLVYLSGFILLLLQIWQTFQTFIERRTTFAIYKKSYDSLSLPTIIFCPRNQFDTGYGIGFTTESNVSDKNWYFRQFYWLNEKFILTINQHKFDKGKSKTIVSRNLTTGENLDEEGKLFLTVEELMNLDEGLCYALVFHENNNKMSINDRFYIEAAFTELGVTIPKVDVSFVSKEDRYGLILPNRGNLQPLTISPEAGIYARVNIEKRVWNYLSIKRTCKHYSVEEEHYMKCLMKHQVNCFRSNASNTG